MTETLFENNSRLNKICKKKLDEARVMVSEGHLYALQLMLWAAESGNNDVKESLRFDLQQQVEAMLNWKHPRRAMQLLSESEDEPGEWGGWILEPLDKIEKMSPREAANELFDGLHLNLSAMRSDYPTAVP